MIGTRAIIWPHNGYLYVASLVGVVGLGFFLWIIGQLWAMSRPTVDTPQHPSYARAYMLVAHVQMLLFIIDQTKIDFLRNPIYQFQVWILFASITAAHGVIAREPVPAPVSAEPREAA
jgi:O-antigen ligase